MLHHAKCQIVPTDKIKFVFVTVLFYDIWPKIMLRSLRRYFDNEIIMVNHLSKPVPKEYYDDNCTIIDNKDAHNNNGHGAGIDVAVKYLRERGDRYFVHIEPDCVFTGTAWIAEMLDAMVNNAIMAGPCRLPFGPIHPCPTIWDIVKIPGSFDISFRQCLIDFNIFNYRLMLDWLINTGMDEGSIWLWCHMWDCGIKNWYMAALQGKAVHTRNDDGYKHFFGGRGYPPTKLLECDYKLVEEYLY